MNLALACSVALLLNTPLPVEVQERDRERMLGDWHSDLFSIKFYDDGSFTLVHPSVTIPNAPSPERSHGRFDLTPARLHGWIDIWMFGKGIYRLQGDELDLLFSHEERPRSFSNPPAGCEVWRFKRLRTTSKDESDQR
jgi:hypothetical protein